MKSKLVEFTPPKAFQMPEGITEGEEFDAVSTFRLKAGGTVCLVMMGDAPMPGYGEEDEHKERESRPSYGEYSDSMMESREGNSAQGTPSGGY